MIEKSKNPIGILSGSTLKLIACLLMAIDHIGYHLYPENDILRIIGRLAMPVFAFLIAEGCYYTKNKLKHFLLIFITGLLFLFGVKIFEGSWYFNIFTQFSISVLYIYLIQFLQKYIKNSNKKILPFLFSLLIFIISLTAGYYLFKLIPFEYGFATTLLPIFVSMLYIKKYTNNKVVNYIDNIFTKVFVTAIFLFLVCLQFKDNPIQTYSFLALPLLLLYNGEVGNKKLKYFFYLFYPLHIIIICLIKMIIF